MSKARVLIVALGVASIQLSSALAQTWDGGASGVGTELGAATNWTTDVLPSVNGGTGLFNGTVAGNLSLTYGNTNFSGGAGNTGLFIALTNTQTGNVAIDSGANTNSFRLGGIYINTGAGAFTLGDGSGTFNITLGGGASIQGFTNNSANTATIRSDVVFGLGGGSVHTNKYDGSGNWLVQNTIGNGTGTQNIWKAGAGTLTLAGTNAVTGSTVVTAGTIEHTGAKTGAGALVISNGLYNVASGASVYASGTSYVGQFNGAGTMTLATNAIFRTGGEVQVSGSAVNGGTGSGVLTLNGATATLSALTIGRGNNNAANLAGTVNVNAGSTLTSTNDIILGFAGATGTKGTLNINGGTVNIGPAGTKWFIMQTYDSANSEVNISSGTFNLMNGTSIKYSTGNTSSAGTNTFNQTGGNVTFYSDGGTNVGGAGMLDLAQSGAAAARNTYNLDGGTLTVPTIGSSTNLATRTFNFNGGVLKAAGATTNFMSLGTGNAVANVRNSGAIIDDGGYLVTLGQALVHSTVGGDAATDGGLTKRGAGTLTLSGANTYNGTTAVNAGALTVSGSIASAATVNSNATLNISGTSAGAVTVNSGTLNLAGTVTNSVTANSGGTVAGTGAATGSLTLNAGSIFAPTTAGTYLTFNGVNVAGATTLNLTGPTTNGSTYNLIKYGAGGITGTNNLSSPFRVTLIDDTANQILQGLVTTLSLGWTGGNGTWANATGGNWNGGNLFYAGDNVSFSDDSSAPTVTVSGSVNPNSTTVNATNDYTISGSGTVVGAGALTKSGNGALTISTSNSFTGGTTINAGKIVVGNASALGAGTNALVFGGAATLDLNGVGVTVGNATGASGTILNNGGSTATLTVSATNAPTLTAILADGTAATALAKTGSGTVTMTGANTYSGNTTISAGALLVTGTLGSGANYGGTIANSGLLYLSNSANQTLSGASPSLGSVLKQGEGTLTLSANNTFSGSGANGIAATFQGGSTRITAGTQTVTGELAVGGTIAAGGAGVNSALTIAGNSAVNVSSWLSVGRGNGTGSVSSDLILSNNAALTAANFSGGWNANSASNTPRGSVTLNDNSSLAITGNGLVYLGESAGSQVAVTLNGASTLTAAGSGSKYIGTAGAGTLTINGSSVANFGTGTTYVGSAAAGSVALNGGSLSGANFSMGNANTAAAVGSVTVSGGTLRATSWLVLGFNGLGTTNQVTINGGAVNVGSAAGNGLLFHQQNTASGVLNISSGSLNVWSNAWITAHPSWASGTATAVINQSGGSVTFFSDAGSTVGGAGYLDLQAQTATGAATNSTTYNLDGGTLTVPKVMSSQATGTRVFNFNGGTLTAAASTNAFFNLGVGGVANVRNGGAIINDNGKAVTIAQALAHSSIGGDNATDGGLTKSGNGTVTLTGANTLNGAVAVNAGTLYANAANVANNATLSYVSGITVAGGATLRSSANALFGWDGSQDKPITVNLNGTLVADNGADVGVSTVTLAGGTLASDGTSDYWGSWRFDNAGDKLLVTENSTVTAANVKFANGGAIEVNAGKTLTYSSAITDLNAAGGGTVSVVKAGAGTMVLAAANTYTGATTVNGGTLKVNGSLASAVTLNSTASLGGSGSIGGLTLASGSTVAPGNSPGTLTINGNTSWLGGANYNWQVLGTTDTPGFLAGTTWDLISATGTLDLSALSISSQFNINLWSLESTGPDVSGDAPDFDGASNYTWTIATAAGGILGFDASAFNINVGSANGTAGFSNSLLGPYGTGSFSMALGGAGNTDLNLVYSAAAPVPEPGTWAAAALLAGGAAFVRWRRKS